MKESKLKMNTLEIIREGIYINIYQELISLIDKDVNEESSKMIPLYDFVQQLEGINKIYPNLVCTNYIINLVKPNHHAKLGGPYYHEYFDISNQYSKREGPSSLEKLIRGIKITIDVLNSKKEEDALYYNLKHCNILCMTNNPKGSKNRRKNVLTKSIRHEVFIRDDYKCVECGATKEDTRLHIDHILPVSQGGTDELSNLQTLCETCNLAKSNRKW